MKSDSPDDISYQVARIIADQLTYLKHYDAEVSKNVHPDGVPGRILVSVPELSLFGDLGIWCNPRFPSAMAVPEIGENVEIYFISGNKDRAVYFGQVHELKGNVIKSYTEPSKKVIFEGKKSKANLILNDKTGGFEITKGTEPMVLGNKAKTQLNVDLDAMTELQSAIDTWIPVPNDGGAALKTALTAFLALPMASYSDILSTKHKLDS